MATTTRPALTPALEDYLETIWSLLQTQRVARVKDIAKRMDVKMASVTPALKRLRNLGYIEYSARAYVELTDQGKTRARRIKARHDILARFFSEVLGVSQENAIKDACAIEHYVSNESIEHFVRFFEFLEICQDEKKEFFERFRLCSLINPDLDRCEEICHPADGFSLTECRKNLTHLPQLNPGENGIIIQIKGNSRQKLIDKGFLPQTLLKLKSINPENGRMEVEVRREVTQLSVAEAAGIVVFKQPPENAAAGS